MDDNYTVVFDNVSKRYSKYEGIQKVDLFLRRIKSGQIGKKLVKEEPFYALRNLSFQLKAGERLGFIGRNGAGKSTTLKLVNKIVYPTEGKITTSGKIGGLLELGAGFNGELSGRENIYINGAILGFERKEIDALFDQIVAISELDKFIDVPLKKYSSGMKVRLGFALTMATSPDIVLLDEVLAVGDVNFKKKSTKMMQEYLKERTLVFVSHSLAQVKEICDRVIVLEEGVVFFDGKTGDAIKAYDELLKSRDQTSKTQIVARGAKLARPEVPKVTVKDCLFPDDNNPRLKHGEDLQAKLLLDYSEILGNLILKINIKKKLGNSISEILDSRLLELGPDLLEDYHDIFLSINSSELLPGKYLLEIIPEFEKQSARTGIQLFKKDFHIIAEDNQEYKGLVDLDIQVEEITEHSAWN